MDRRGIRDVAVTALAASLLLGAGVAMAALWRTKAIPGAAGDTPLDWPADSTLERAADGPTLILFAHPKCACTVASLAELRKILARGEVHAEVVFAEPAGVGAEWRTGGSVGAAAAIPGVRVRFDPRGVEAARFGAATSGHVVLYDAGGRLQYSGGITGARGHEGDNAGAAQVAERLAQSGATGAPGGRPTFGCPLADVPGAAP